MREKLLVSACLLGVSCRYDGKSKGREEVSALAERYDLIPVCPEQLGGLPTPREPSEILGDRVVSRTGEDVTGPFRKGAEETLRIARLTGCRKALLKSKSPSCGSGLIYDGTFSRTLAEGDGVTARLLKENGLEVFGEGETALL